MVYWKEIDCGRGGRRNKAVLRWKTKKDWDWMGFTLTKEPDGKP